jgi:hypothetical protein
VAHIHLSKSSIEKVIFIIEESGERILSSKKLSENIIGTLHVEVLEVLTSAETSVALEIAATATSVGATTLFYVFATISVIIFSFLLV